MLPVGANFPVCRAIKTALQTGDLKEIIYSRTFSNAVELKCGMFF
jgi:hypothetical protein